MFRLFDTVGMTTNNSKVLRISFRSTFRQHLFVIDFFAITLMNLALLLHQISGAVASLPVLNLLGLVLV